MTLVAETSFTHFFSVKTFVFLFGFFLRLGLAVAGWILPVALLDLILTAVLLSQLPEGWGYRCVPLS